MAKLGPIFINLHDRCVKHRVISPCLLNHDGLLFIRFFFRGAVFLVRLFHDIFRSWLKVVLLVLILLHIIILSLFFIDLLGPLGFGALPHRESCIEGTVHRIAGFLGGMLRDDDFISWIEYLWLVFVLFLF